MRSGILGTLLQLCAVIAFGQTNAEIVMAVQSPESLKSYLTSHNKIDWAAIRSALGLTSEDFFAPCGGDVPLNEAPCSVEILSISKPSQAIVTVRTTPSSIAIEVLRYSQLPVNVWKFVAEQNERSSYATETATELRQVNSKPFLLLSRDRSGAGVGIRDTQQLWYDLALPGFEPVFSVSSEAHQFRFGFGVSRDIQSTLRFSQTGERERIEVTLHVRFSGLFGFIQDRDFLGEFARGAGQNQFTLVRAYSGLDRRISIPNEDFEALADVQQGPSNEKLLAYAFPGLQKIAAGSDEEARGWLRFMLEHTEDTPEKRALLKLLDRK